VVPRATCLAQAIAARWLLPRTGNDVVVWIGVAAPGPDFEAHAWVESGGDVILGGRPDRFAPLMQFGRRS
jgi:hypothetical protein